MKVFVAIDRTRINAEDLVDDAPTSQYLEENKRSSDGCDPAMLPIGVSAK
jgi:hypothetical protein